MQSFIKTAKELIAIPSTDDNPAALTQALELMASQLLHHQNITIERFVSNGKPSLLAYRGSTRPKMFRVLLNGHVDVVPAKNELFAPVTRDSRLYGRGTLDMKVAALAMVQVFRDLAEKLPYDLGLQIVTDEEVGGEYGTAYQLSQGVTTQLAIAGESTPLGAMCNESRGLCWAEIDFRGVSGHSAYPWNGTNAILLAQAFTQKLLAAIPTPAQDEWCTTATIATISTPNTAFNSIPDQAHLGIDIRFIASDRRFASHQSTSDFLENLAPKGSRVTIQKLEPSHFADPKTDDLQRLAQAVAKVSGQPAHFIRKHGAADIRFFSQRNMTAVTLGVQGKGQHSDNEYVELPSIEHYIATLKEFLENLKA